MGWQGPSTPSALPCSSTRASFAGETLLPELLKRQRLSSETGPCFYPSTTGEQRRAHPQAHHCHRNHFASKPRGPTELGLEGGRKAALDGRACAGQRRPLLSLFSRMPGNWDPPSSTTPPPPSLPLPPGSCGPSLTRAWLSQQVDNGDIGENDVAVRHGFLQFRSLAAPRPAAMLLRRGARVSFRDVTVPSDVIEAAPRPFPVEACAICTLCPTVPRSPLVSRMESNFLHWSSKLFSLSPLPWHTGSLLFLDPPPHPHTLLPPG